MPAITLQLIVQVPNNSLPLKLHRHRHKVGDIIAVHRTADYATFDGAEWRWNEPISPKWAMVHISNFPTSLLPKLQRLRERIGQLETIQRRFPIERKADIEAYIASGERVSRFIGAPTYVGEDATTVTYQGTIATTARLRRLRIDLSQAPTFVKNKLRIDREITVTWGQVRGYIRRKVIVDLNNPDLDDESNALTDTDL